MFRMNQAVIISHIVEISVLKDTIVLQVLLLQNPAQLELLILVEVRMQSAIVLAVLLVIIARGSEMRIQLADAWLDIIVLEVLHCPLSMNLKQVIFLLSEPVLKPHVRQVHITWTEFKLNAIRVQKNFTVLIMQWLHIPITCAHMDIIAVPVPFNRPNVRRVRFPINKEIRMLRNVRLVLLGIIVRLMAEPTLLVLVMQVIIAHLRPYHLFSKLKRQQEVLALQAIIA